MSSQESKILCSLVNEEKEKALKLIKKYGKKKYAYTVLNDLESQMMSTYGAFAALFLTLTEDIETLKQFERENVET